MIEFEYPVEVYFSDDFRENYFKHLKIVQQKIEERKKNQVVIKIDADELSAQDILDLIGMEQE